MVEREIANLRKLGRENAPGQRTNNVTLCVPKTAASIKTRRTAYHCLADDIGHQRKHLRPRLAGRQFSPLLLLGINRVFNTGHFFKYAMYLAAIAKLIVIPAV